MAPESANPRTEISGLDSEPSFTGRKRTLSERLALEDWEGVNTLTHALDLTVEVDLETSLFHGKKVLEIGFASGLPSVYAWESGAAELAIHHPSKTALELYTLPTLRRNNIPTNKCKLGSGTLEDLKKMIGSNKFDVILGADILNRDSSEYELLHEIISDALADDGICVFSAQTLYTSVDGCLAKFLTVAKNARKLDALERWSSPRTDVIQRKVVQLTKSLF
jgi:hypothetical protein